MPDIYDEMAARWPSPVVARRKIEHFTGGAVKPKHLANLDSLGNGPPERVIIAGHVCYPVASLTDWLRSRCSRRS